MTDRPPPAQCPVHGHSPESIQERLAAPRTGSYLRDFVFGAIDGTVTTFAIVSGVAGAGLSPSIVIILGAANLLGDGFSMAAGNYLATRADQQVIDKARAMEEQHIELYPDGEREEIRQIFASKGFTGDDLERVVEVITSDRHRWVETMLIDEHGLSLHGPAPLPAAATTFAAFLIAGLIPLLPFIVSWIQRGDGSGVYAISTTMTAVAFFSIGAMKSRVVERSWILGGVETLAIGGSAAALAYAVGLALKGMVA